MSDLYNAFYFLCYLHILIVLLTVDMPKGAFLREEKWPLLHSSHSPLSLRLPLWRGSPVLVKFFVYFYFAEHEIALM